MKRLLIDMLPGGTYAVRLEGTEELLVSGTREPLRDGASALLAQDYDPGVLMTMRVRGRSSDTHARGPIGDFAKSVDACLRRAPWVPLPHECDT
ncbi:hypothetical protein [Reyranella sp.]|uniref:hypothetical protein n=1 Tax=Reyranella sp. TaxID=1929291 RepID=UPI003D0FD275